MEKHSSIIFVFLFVLLALVTNVSKAEIFDQNSVDEIYYSRSNSSIDQAELQKHLSKNNVKAYSIDKQTGLIEAVSKNFAKAAVAEAGSFILVKAGEVSVMVGSLGTVRHGLALRAIGYSVDGSGLALSAYAGYYAGKGIVLVDEKWFNGYLVNRPARAILYPIFDMLNEK